MGGVVEPVDYECDYAYVRDIDIDHNGARWACPMLFPKNCWVPAAELSL